MPHSLTKIWIHAVFGAKNSELLIHPSIEKRIYTHIKGHLEADFGCEVRTINGMPNHIHILFLLNVNYAVKDILKNIKGESSHWVNENNLIKGRFAWQTGYGTFSVSESNIEKVERYIRNQKEHHRKKTFAEEYADFMKKHGLQFIQGSDNQLMNND